MKGDRIAEAQAVPIKFLENILAELRRHGLVDSRRGAEGGYWLRVPAETVTVADVIRIVDGPLANIRGLRPDEIRYPGHAAPLRDVWLALRTSMRGVLEHVTLADIAGAQPARRSRSSPTSRRRRSASLATTAACAPCGAGAGPDDAARRELEVVGLLAGDLRPDRRAVAEREVDAHLEAEARHALDHRLQGLAVGLVDQHDVVRAHEALADLGDRADEAHDEGVGGLLVDLGRRADLLHLRVVHDDDAVRDVHRLGLVVRDEDRRHVDLVVQAPQPRAQVGAHPRVERAEGLVQQQHARLDGERAGQGHALALAAGELRRVAVAEAGQLHEAEQLLDARLDLRLRPLADAQAERDVLEHRHVLERGVVLEDEADVAALRRRAGRVDARDLDRARIRRLQAGHDPQQRALAAAARAEQRRERAVGDVDR